MPLLESLSTLEKTERPRRKQDEGKSTSSASSGKSCTIKVRIGSLTCGAEDDQDKDQGEDEDEDANQADLMQDTPSSPPPPTFWKSARSFLGFEPTALRYMASLGDSNG